MTEQLGYFIRIQQLDGYEEKIQSLKLVKDYTKILCVRHQGDTKENPHYHMTVAISVAPKAFRARMVKLFDKDKGNGHMSIKPWDGKIECNSYMFHEGDPLAPLKEIKKKILALAVGYADQEIEEIRKKNVEIKEKVEIAKGKASWKLEEIVLKKFQLVDNKYTRNYDIAREILKTCFETDKYQPNDFQLKLMSDRILYKLQNTEEERNLVINSIVSRIKWD